MSQSVSMPASPVTADVIRPITVRIKDACRITGIGRSKLYLLIASGEIATIKVGSMTLIPMASIETFLAGCPAG